MIRNFKELIIVINQYEKQIKKRESEIKHLILKLDFKKVRKLECEKRLLEQQIRNYIAFYRKKIKSNYIENKLFGDELNCLEIKFESKSVLNEIIYCVQLLKLEYENLKKDVQVFLELGRVSDSLAIDENSKQVLDRVKIIFDEGKFVFNNSEDKISEIELNQYNELLNYFELIYKKRKKDLGIQLKLLKSRLNWVLVIFNFRLAKQLRMEIKELEKELKKY